MLPPAEVTQEESIEPEDPEGPEDPEEPVEPVETEPEIPIETPEDDIAPGVLHFSSTTQTSVYICRHMVPSFFEYCVTFWTDIAAMKYFLVY